MKFRLRLFAGKLNHIHFIQFFLTGHGHVPGGDPCFVSGYKILEIRNFLLLLVVSGLQLRLFHGIDFLELVIIPYIACQGLVIHVVNQVDNAV